MLGSLGQAIDAASGVDSVAPPQVNDAGTAAVMQVVPTTSPQDEATTDLIHRLRDDVIPTALSRASAGDTEVHVGGATAMNIDMSERIEGRLPWFIGAVILLSILLLTVVFRSIAVPLIDATIVRVVLVPATMKLLGDRNWWLPRWLDRVLPRVDIEGGTGLPEPEYEPGRGPGVVTTPDTDRAPGLVP